MPEYPLARGYGEQYGHRESGGRMNMGGHGFHSRYGHHGRPGSGFIDNGEYGRYDRSGGCIVDSGEYDRYGRHGQSGGCIVDSGEYGRYGRNGQSAGCIVDSGEYDRHGRYVDSGGCIVDGSEYGRPIRGIHRSNHAEPSSYMDNLSPYAAGMGNGSVSVPPVVSPTFCVPYMAQFVIEQKVMTLSSGKFIIRDTQGRLLFDVESKFFGIHTKRILCDPKGVPLVLLKKMNITMHDRWEAYRGDDSHDSNMLFVMKKSAIYQMKPSFDIFLGANTSSSKADFTLKGDYLQHNYTIFFHHTPIAEASRKVNLQSVVAGKDQYGVTVFPGVDHAFIASIIVIVDQIKQDDTGSSK